jgi:D-beta-D-heptose 7-phosphate kinase/D-beta-D-heptose 1-phosphate adenosyltransferase
VKGADWAEDAIVGKEVVEEHGGHVIRIQLTEGASTTKIIERILANYRE